MDHADLGALAIVTVTYNPDIGLLATQCAQLPQQARRYIVDNASTGHLRIQIRAIAREFGCILIENDRNIGLPGAQNQGLASAMATGCRFMLLLDQDTEPGPTGVQALLTQLAAHQGDGRDTVVGPRLIDAHSGLEHGFHVVRRHLQWARVHPGPGDPPVECANLNASGTMMPAKVFARVGPMDADLFIDHVDTEWAFRAQWHGVRLLGIPQVAFVHRMGERTWRIWCFGWRVWPYRSPLRHYYLFRNATTLMRRAYVPRVWKGWAVVKLMITFALHAVFDRDRASQVREMCRGVRDGWREARGKA